MPSSLRVVFQQPALPAYRIPLFRRLARSPGIELLVVHGSEPGLDNAPADGFAAELRPARRARLPLAGELLWDHSQWRLAGAPTTDLLVLPANARYLSLWPALLRARVRGLPVMIWGHGYSKSPGRWRDLLRRRLAALPDALMFYDAKTARGLVAAGVPSARVHVAPNGLDRAPIVAARRHARADVTAIRTLRDRHSLVRGATLLHVGRLHADNRLDVLVDAIPALIASHPALRLVIVGDGAQERRRLATRAEALGIGERLVWAGAVYEEDAIARWMVLADVFVYPSNAGLALVHAFNYGIPAVVCAPVERHNPEIDAFEDGRNGLLAPALGAAALAGTLHRVLGDEALRGRLAVGAARTAVTTRTTDTMAEAFEHAFRSLSPGGT